MLGELSKIDATGSRVEGFLGRCSTCPPVLSVARFAPCSGIHDTPQGAASDRLGTRTAINVCQVAVAYYLIYPVNYGY